MLNKIFIYNKPSNCENITNQCDIYAVIPNYFPNGVDREFRLHYRFNDISKILRVDIFTRYYLLKSDGMIDLLLFFYHPETKDLWKIVIGFLDMYSLKALLCVSHDINERSRESKNNLKLSNFYWILKLTHLFKLQKIEVCFKTVKFMNRL